MNCIYILSVIIDLANASFWSPLLFLVMIYTQSLLTVGDDEFFSLSTSSAVMPRNPLSIDDLIVFSRQLLNIVFPLYQLEDQGKMKSSGPHGIPLTWEKVREYITSCLKGIHARESVLTHLCPRFYYLTVFFISSRRPFTPLNHWLVSSQLNLHSFVEAAM